MKITVTKRHIKKGLRGVPDRCPIALALKEKIHQKVTVGCREIYYRFQSKPSNRFRSAFLPLSAAQFVDDFDLDHKVKPFTFEVSFTSEDTVDLCCSKISCEVRC